MIDTHAHLNSPDFDTDRNEVIEKALGAGVRQIIEIADEPKEWDGALSLARRYPQKIYCAWGWHPHYAGQKNDKALNRLENQKLPSEILAIGEIGIDYFRSRSDPQSQKMILERLLNIAAKLQQPIIIHAREGAEGRAFDDLFSVLKSLWRAPLAQRRFQGVIHCFSGGPHEARQALDLGLALGIDGPITYPKNTALRETIKTIGLAHLVLETDSPYLPPQSIRGQRNDPGQIPTIADCLTSIFNLPRQTIAEKTTHNAAELFGLPNKEL
ncbi:MAG: TatD family hydrolase [Elusimicrobia bacterium]|nr:TatD family hydrolase [Elusimicrobiota bacterium]